MDLLSKAISLAARAFDGMERKCERHPAILHSLEAAVIVQSVTDEPEAVIAAVLHDTVEDAGITLAEIRKDFGNRVAELVRAETERRLAGRGIESTWRTRKEESIALLKKTDDIGIKALYLGDKLSNIRSLCRSKKKYGDDMWKHFYQHDPNQHKWYYTSIAEELKVFEGTQAYEEYLMLIKQTFE